MTTPKQNLEEKWEEEFDELLTFTGCLPSIRRDIKFAVYKIRTQAKEEARQDAYYEEGLNENWGGDRKIQLDNAFQEGYKKGRVRCLQQHRAEELKEAVEQAKKETKQEVLEEMQEILPNNFLDKKTRLKLLTIISKIKER